MRTSINYSYSDDDDAIFETAQILRSSTITKSVSPIQTRDSNDLRKEESEEYR